MHEGQDHPAPSPEKPRPTRRPPYGLPLHDRPRLRAASDSVGWRRYATPTPPRRSLLRKRLRLARPTLIAGFLTCVGFGIWSSGWATDSASHRTNVASTPTPRQSVAGRSLVATAPPTPKPKPKLKPKPKPRTLSSATPSSSSKAPKNKAIPPGNRHRPAVSAVPRQRHQPVPSAPLRKTRTTIPADRVRKTRSVDPKDSDRERAVPPIAAKCDELFPPARPEFQIRNQACHELLG